MWTENKEKKKEKAHIKHNVCTYDELIKLNSNRQRKIKRRASLTVLRPVQTNTGGDSPPDRSPVFTHILQGKGEGVYRPAPCKCDLIYILPTLCHILSAVVRNWPPALTSTLHSCTAPEWSESGHRHSFIPAVVVVNLSCVFKVLKRKKRSRINLFFFKWRLQPVQLRISGHVRRVPYQILALFHSHMQSGALTYNTCFIRYTEHDADWPRGTGGADAVTFYQGGYRS